MGFVPSMQAGYAQQRHCPGFLADRFLLLFSIGSLGAQGPWEEENGIAEEVRPLPSKHPNSSLHLLQDLDYLSCVQHRLKYAPVVDWLLTS